jgi:RIO kinase 2
MRLDITLFRYLGKDEIRVLTAIEMGMRNHEIVPTQLIQSIARIRRGNCHKLIKQLLKYKLIVHDNKKYDGYSLAYQGYDTLAIYTFMKRGKIVGIGNMIGTGKESDIYLCVTEDGEEVILKLARLGRISFKAVRNKRDYLKNRFKGNWLYVSRLAAVREYSFMEILH